MVERGAISNRSQLRQGEGIALSVHEKLIMFSPLLVSTYRGCHILMIVFGLYS